MKKYIFLLSIIIILSFNISFSQHGYKNFRWGMKINKVIKLVPELIEEKYPSNLSYFCIDAYYYKYGINQSGTIPDPLENCNMVFRCYKNEEENIKYYFLDSLLFAISIDQTVAEDYSFEKELGKKYGNEISKYLKIGDGFEYRIKAWFNSGDRIIVFHRDKLNDESVTYLNKDLFYKLSSPIMENIKKESKNKNKRLD
jgi:hypothetical protein